MVGLAARQLNFFLYFSFVADLVQGPANQRSGELSDEHRNRRDDALIKQYRNGGNLQVLGELYKPYMSLVYGICLKYLKGREESRDAVMQIFEKLVDALRKHEVRNFKSWLYSLARNYCLMQLRAEKGRHFEDISLVVMESESITHQDDGLGHELKLGRLERCIEELGPEQKQCVQLFYLKQKCYKEIQDVTGFDGNKVKSYIQNGKRNLKICMERNE